MHMEGRSDRIVRWEATGAEKAAEVQEAWIKKWMWRSAVRARRLQPVCPVHTHARAHTVWFEMPGHTHTHAHTPYSPLPQPAPAPPPDPVIPFSPPPTHYSLSTYLPQLSGPPPVPSPRSLPAGWLSVDVKVGGVVSNSPSDTRLLTFCCTLRIEGFLCLLAGVSSHRPWRLPVHSGGSGLAQDREGGDGGACAVMTQSVRLDPPQSQPPSGPEADNRQTCYLLPEPPLRKLSGGIMATHHLPQRPLRALCLHSYEQPPFKGLDMRQCHTETAVQLPRALR